MYIISAREKQDRKCLFAAPLISEKISYSTVQEAYSSKLFFPDKKLSTFDMRSWPIIFAESETEVLFFWIQKTLLGEKNLITKIYKTQF